MVKSFNAQERQEIKAFLDALLDGPAPLDTSAVEAAFWDRLRPHLAVNSQTQGMDQLDALVRAVLDGQPGAALAGPVFLLSPVSSPTSSSARSSASGKGEAKAPARRSSKRAAATTKSVTAKKPRTTSPPASPHKSHVDSLLLLSRSVPKDVRVAVEKIMAQAEAFGKMPWRIAYAWKGRHLWYDPVKFDAVHREHWRFYMAFRMLFWCWALHAPLQKAGTDLRRKLKMSAIQARLRFISMCIETWGYYGLLERLEGHDELFWYGGQPGKCANGVRPDGGVPAEDLTSLYRSDPTRYQFMADHALDPALIDNYGYHSLRELLESTGALEYSAKPAFRLTDEALARVRKDIMSSRTAKPGWVGDMTADPWKQLKNSTEIKRVQDELFKKINNGTFELPTTPALTTKELQADDVSDFEVDGVPSALAPDEADADASEEDEEEEDAGEIESEAEEDDTAE